MLGTTITNVNFKQV